MRGIISSWLRGLTIESAPEPWWKHWSDLCCWSKRKTKKPLSSPTYCLYFLLIIVGAGGVGICFSQTPQDFVRGMLTYSIAIIAASCVLLALDTSDTNTRPQYIRSFFMSASIFVIIADAIMMHHSDKASLVLLPSILFTVYSLWQWWVINADDNKLIDRVNPVAPIGGDSGQNVGGTDGGYSL